MLADSTLLSKLRRYENGESKELKIAENVKNFSVYTDADASY